MDCFPALGESQACPSTAIGFINNSHWDTIISRFVNLSSLYEIMEFHLFFLLPFPLQRRHLTFLNIGLNSENRHP
jgi:hypothetical protein